MRVEIIYEIKTDKILAVIGSLKKGCTYEVGGIKGRLVDIAYRVVKMDSKEHLTYEIRLSLECETMYQMSLCAEDRLKELTEIMQYHSAELAKAQIEADGLKGA